MAENELNSARNLLLENDMVISCKRCKLVFDVFIDMQFGDLNRKRPEKGYLVQFSSHALQLYRNALDKLDHDDFESSLNLYKKKKTVGILWDKNNMQGAQHAVPNAGKRPSTFGEVRLPECGICSSNLKHNAHHADKVHLENMESEGPDRQKGTRKSSRIPSKCLPKKQCLISELKPKTRLSRRTNNKSACVTDEVDNNDARSVDDHICVDTLNRRSSRVKVNGNSSTNFGSNEECISNNIKCWRCLLLKVMVDGTMQNIICLKWECHRRRLVLQLLLKIGIELLSI